MRLKPNGARLYYRAVLPGFFFSRRRPSGFARRFVNCNNSTGAPDSSIKATNTAGEGEFASISTFFPFSAALRSFTSKATCGSVRTSYGTWHVSRYNIHWIPNGFDS